MKLLKTKVLNPFLVLFGYVSLAGSGAALRAQAPAAQTPQAAMEDAVTRQRNAVAAMQESLARQQASIQKQLGQSDAKGGFFVLPPPVRMGNVENASATFDCDPLPAPEVSSLVGDAAKREGLDADLLRNVMKQESGFRPCAVSAKGAMGLMQLMPATAAQFGVRDVFDPRENVDAGASLIKQLLTRYGGDVFKALSAYNAGPARVDAADGVPQIRETLDYVNRILSAMPGRDYINGMLYSADPAAGALSGALGAGLDRRLPGKD